MRNKFAVVAGAVLLAGAALGAAPSASAASAKPGSGDIVRPFGSDSAHSYGSSSTCSHSADGWFVSYGDTTHISDTCQDGWSAVLEVDEYPSAGAGYDYLVQDNNGVNTTVVHTHDIPEGTVVWVRAGMYHPSTGEIRNLGSWVSGVA